MTRQEKVHKWNMEWNRSIAGVCKRLWHHNTRNSKLRGHKPPTYTQKELEDWIISQPNFNALYTTWVESGYDRLKAVSIDRLKNSKGYSFDNIQLVDFQTNCDNATRDIKYKVLHNSGLFNGGHRAVTQFTLTGKPICSHISMSAAAEHINAKDHRAISDACRGRLKSYKKYLWTYADNFDNFIANHIEETSRKAIKGYKEQHSTILQYSLDGIFIKEHKNVVEAAKATNLTYNLVSKWTNNKPTKIKPIFIFKRKEPIIE